MTRYQVYIRPHSKAPYSITGPQWEAYDNAENHMKHLRQFYPYSSFRIYSIRTTLVLETEEHSKATP